MQNIWNFRNCGSFEAIFTKSNVTVHVITWSLIQTHKVIGGFIPPCIFFCLLSSIIVSMFGHLRQKQQRFVILRSL